jgi:hypothetical protein
MVHHILGLKYSYLLYKIMASLMPDAVTVATVLICIQILISIIANLSS